MILPLPADESQARRAIRYIAVLIPVIAASAVLGVIFGPITGIAAFTALAGVFLPKPGQFFMVEDEKVSDELDALIENATNEQAEADGD